MFENQTVTVVACAVGFAERAYDADPQGRWQADVSRQVFFVDESYGAPVKVKFKGADMRAAYEAIKAAGPFNWYHLECDTSRGSREPVAVSVRPYEADDSTNGRRAKAGAAG